MNAVRRFAPLILGLLACLGFGPLGLAAAHPAPAQGPVLVIAPPWGGGPAARIAAAGGRLLGPTAPWAALAEGAAPASLREAGAWMILDPALAGVFCGGGNL